MLAGDVLSVAEAEPSAEDPRVSHTQRIANTTVLVLDPGDPVISTPRHVSNLVGDALSEGATAVIVPIDALAAEFFQLRTGFAAELLQKAAVYRMKLAIVGDVSEHRAASNAFNDLVVESTHASGYQFVTSLEEAHRWLRPAQA